jgi:AcrR family transcriptional regulator
MELSKPGRPRDPRVDAAVRDTTRALVAEVGYDAMTVDAVAQRAGVSKAALYRRWRSKGALVYEVLLSGAPVSRLEYSGDIEADLRTVVASNVVGFRNRKTRAVLLAVLADALRDEALAADLRDGFFGPRAEQIRAMVTAAVERGELDPSVPADFVPAVLTGPMLYALMVFGRAPSDDDLEALVRSVVEPYRRRGRTRSRRR